MKNKPVNPSESDAEEKLAVTLPGTVEKIIPSVDPKDADKAQIHIDGAQPLYREIRVDNVLTDKTGEEAKLKVGSHVEITIEADANAVIPKSDANEKKTVN